MSSRSSRCCWVVLEVFLLSDVFLSFDVSGRNLHRGHLCSWSKIQSFCQGNLSRPDAVIEVWIKLPPWMKRLVPSESLKEVFRLSKIHKRRWKDKYFCSFQFLWEWMYWGDTACIKLEESCWLPVICNETRSVFISKLKMFQLSFWPLKCFTFRQLKCHLLLMRANFL